MGKFSSTFGFSSLIFSYPLDVVLKLTGRWRWGLWRLKRLEKWGGRVMKRCLCCQPALAILQWPRKGDRSSSVGQSPSCFLSCLLSKIDLVWTAIVIAEGFPNRFISPRIIEAHGRTEPRHLRLICWQLSMIVVDFGRVCVVCCFPTHFSRAKR